MKLGLTLGGGGARGGVHVGAWDALHKADIRPDLITGTSIGGFVGALIAAGKSVEEMHEAFDRLDVLRMFGFATVPNALTDNTNFRRVLEEMFGKNTHFEDLDIPLVVTATDLITQRSIVIDSGPLVPAILATTAIPLVFPPVEHKGYILLDGGLLNNTPFDIARARGADIVIAVDLSNSAVDDAAEVVLDIEQTNNMLGWVFGTSTPPQKIITLMLDIVTVQGMEMRTLTAPPDLLLRPQIGFLSILDFANWEQGVPLGKQAVQDALPTIQNLMDQFNKREMRLIAPTAADKEKSARVLNELLPLVIDARAAYETAAGYMAEIGEANLATVFENLAEQRAGDITRLQTQVRALGSNPRQSGTLANNLRRGWFSLERLINGGDARLVLRTIGNGAADVLTAFDKALEEDLPETILRIIRDQRDNVAKTQAFLRDEMDALDEA